MLLPNCYVYWDCYLALFSINLVKDDFASCILINSQHAGSIFIKLVNLIVNDSCNDITIAGLIVDI
jgi:hypothetical protein